MGVLCESQGAIASHALFPKPRIHVLGLVACSGRFDVLLTSDCLPRIDILGLC